MSACCPTCGAPAPRPIQGPRNTQPLRPAARPLAYAIRNPDEVPELTLTRETDVSTALARGLAEYLGQQSIEIGGRRLSLMSYSTWAEPEQAVSYPAIAVAPSAGTYDRSISPVTLIEQVDGDLRLVAFTELETSLTMELWATDPRERTFLCAMIEEALSPVDWMYGLRLVLPFYHNAVSTFELKQCQYMDNADDAMAKYRKAQFTVEATATVYRVQSIPDSKPVFRLEMSE